MLFSAFSTRYFVKISISIKCKMTGIFSALQQYFRGFVNLIHIKLAKYIPALHISWP